MKFDEFYKLLREVLDKVSCGVEPSEDNFNMFLANRYLSFYHPELAKLINETSNKLPVASNHQNGESAFEYLKAVVPKVKYKFIKYIKKPAVENQRNMGVSDEEIREIAAYKELSTREVRNNLLFLNKIN